MKKLIKYLILTVVIIVGAATGTYYLSPGTVINAATGYSKWKADIDTRTVGVEKFNWPYLEAGSKSNETIVFIHGFGSSKEPWIEMMAHFSKKYHVVAPDLPGFGKNKYIEGVEYTMQDQADRLDKFLTAIGVDKFHLIGVSMGGYISARYASTVRYQERLLSLLLMDSAGVNSPQQSYYVKHLISTGENLLVPEDVEGFGKMMAIVYHVPPQLPDHFAEYIIEVRKERLKEENLLFQGMLKSLESPLEESLPMIKAKTLIMWGDKDRIIHPSSVSVFEKGIKNHQTVIFKDIGHVPFREAPVKTNQAYETFLSSL